RDDVAHVAIEEHGFFRGVDVSLNVRTLVEAAFQRFLHGQTLPQIVVEERGLAAVLLVLLATRGAERVPQRIDLVGGNDFAVDAGDGTRAGRGGLRGERQRESKEQSRGNETLHESSGCGSRTRRGCRGYARLRDQQAGDEEAFRRARRKRG